MVKRSKRLIIAITTIACSLILTMIPTIRQVSPAQAADPPWTKYAGEVTLEGEKYVIDAWVIKDGSTYRMWYTHAKTDLSISEIVSGITAIGLGDIIAHIADLNLSALSDDLAAIDVGDMVAFLEDTSTVIGYATSSNGITWTIEDSEALPGDSSGLWNSVGAPCVIKDDTEPDPQKHYKMWYTRLETDLTETSLETILGDLDKDAILELLNSTRTVIGYATSPNGENWTVPDDEVLAGNGNVLNSVGDPCVIKDDGTYEMWYTHLKTDLTETDLDDILANPGGFDVEALLELLDGTAIVIGYATSPDGVDWTVVEPEALPGNTAFWDSVANPSVLKDGNDYEMWYTRIKTDLTQQDLEDILDEIIDLDIPGFLDTLEAGDLEEFLEKLAALDIAELKDLLSDTSTVIGYATSDDGEDWTVEDPESLGGSPLWSSVGAPSVIRYDLTYKMWYTEGISDLTFDNLLALLLGDDPPIGYAYYIPSPRPGRGAPGGGGGIPRVLEIEVTMDDQTNMYDMSDDGKILDTIDVTSEDGQLNVSIPRGTTTLDEADNPLISLEFTVDETPPLPPPGANIIGLPYNFEPKGATFYPPIIITWSYNRADISPGVAEEDLVIAYYDEDARNWEVLPSSVVDPVTNIIMAFVDHLTTFAIIAYAIPPPPPPLPAAFTTGSLSISPLEVDIGQPVTISVVVTNIGEGAGSYTITLKINGEVEATEERTLAGGTSEKVTFTTSRDEVGTYSVDVNGVTGLFTVETAPPPPSPPPPVPTPVPPARLSWWLIGVIIAAVVIAIAVPLTLRRRRRLG